MVRYTLEQRVFLYETYVKHGSPTKCWQIFQSKFYDGRVPSRQTIHNLASKLRTTGLLIDKKQKHMVRVLTVEKLDRTGARLEHTPRKSSKPLAQETGVSNSSASKVTQLLKLRPFKTITFFSDEVLFYLQRYVNTKNNRYWSSQNPHLTREVPLHPVKVGVWRAVSARIVGPVFFNKTIDCERHLQVILGQFFLELTGEVRLYDWFLPLPTLHISMQAFSDAFGDRSISSDIWPARSPDLILVTFLLGFFEGQSLQQ
ncbi:hypothetical protein B7P43_G11429 [Cryptotermes secundus]|uniref:DUF4817 domain-containing protein n=1 Tax=Cryptotermes secundus TaxID=105785 RepID=A0A2J7QYP9_9NEOP|nr:hypothetical protein B7P43_G11429 [Cryptotermes secundus]